MRYQQFRRSSSFRFGWPTNPVGRDFPLRILLVLIVLGLPGLVAPLANGQTASPNAYPVPPGVYPVPTSTPIADKTRLQSTTEMSYADVYRLLLSRGLTEEAANELMRDYDPDRKFTPGEVSDILRRVRPEDLSTRRKKEETAAEVEASAVVPQQLGVSPEPVPFGYEVFVGAPESYEPEQDLAVGNDYRLGPGDELKISVWGSVTQDFFAVVDREGNVTIPEVGVLPAAGKTMTEFEAELDRELRKVFSGFKLGVTLRRLRRIQVVVAGDVARPGAYFLSPVSTAFNALYFAGGPTPEGSLRRVRVVRDGVIVAEVDLYPYLMFGDTSNQVRLLSGDTVFIMHKGPVATLRGEVNRPAIFELLGRETVADLVRMGAGFTPTVHPERATLDRVSPATGPMSVELNLTGLLRPDSTLAADDPALLPLQAGDNLTLYSIYHVEPRRFVEIQGMVQYPGIYPLFPDSRVSDLVYRAGGLLDSAYPIRAELSRLALAGGDTLADDGDEAQVSRLIYVELSEALAHPRSESDLTLQKGDKLYIRKIPGWKFQETVKIAGEVKYPGIYPILLREERLSDFIQRAGGVTDESFLKGASLFRKGQGRVIIDFEKALKKTGDRENIVLADEDSIFVPPYPPTILVEGEVSQPGALIYKPGQTADYYVDRTGGVTDDADKGETRIIRVDGIVQKAFRTLARDPKVEPGSRIVVAAKPEGEGVNWGNVFKDTVTILASLATTIFVITEINNNN
ncbi:MAG TPA: SLBB domain-containing protein [Candidatus Eisenbacteria bacterium]